MVEFRILGCLEAESGGRLVPVGGLRERRVLAVLALEAGRVVPVSRLAEVLWDDDPPVTAGKQVRNAVSVLRGALAGAGAGDLIVTVAGGYRLAAAGCMVDARVFEAGVAAAGVAVSEGRLAEAAGLLRSALGLWRGPVLGGLAGGGLEPLVAVWDERRAAARELCCEVELALGRHREVVGELAGLVADYPLREKLAGLYMVALYRCGRQADALAAYQAIRGLLADQLGLDPGPELQELQRQILTAAPALAAPDLAPAGAGHDVSLPSAAAGGLLVAPQVRYGLPADTAAFTGRGGEVARIMVAVRDAAAAGGVVAIHAIDGMPGVGKTALAVHVAHALVGQFPDRQLFIDLHGHTPGHEPVKAVDALAGLLTATGVDPRFLPGDLDGRAGLWRDRMAGQRALLVLDNAASTSQVTPLLPGADCLVLVTSRRHLGDLPGLITPVLLDALPSDVAQEMFSRLAPRAAADLAGVAEVVRLAGFLPLAVSLLARVFARHPSWTLADLAAETRDGLLTLTAESDSVAAAFEVSCQHLDPARQRLFRLLGVHPGITTDAWAAAALAGTSPAEAAGLLDGLHGEGLLTETGHRRYGMHDLLRRYARDRAAANPDDDRDQALDRLLDYYEHAAARAQARLARQTQPGRAPSAPSAAPATDDPGQALAWARADRDNLLACLDHAAQAGLHARLTALTASLAELLRRDGSWAEAISRHAAAVRAARHLGDRLCEANALTDLGEALRQAGDYPGAASHLEQALALYRDLGERLGQANALTRRGDVRRHIGDHPGASGDLEQALALYRDLGDRLGQANALTSLGDVRRMTGQYPEAVADLEQALALYRDLGDQLGQATALIRRGDVRRLTGDYPDAVSHLERALVLSRDLGDRHGQATALICVAEVRQLTGDYPGATCDLEQALALYRDLGDRLGQANALTSLGDVRRMTGQYPEAVADLEQALALYRDLGDRLGRANALTRRGQVRRVTNDYPGAARDLEQALALYRDTGNQGGEALVLNERGTLHRTGGELAQAEHCHRRALELACVIASSWGEASALAGLGRCAVARGQPAQAQALLRQAHEIFQRIGAADAPSVLAELHTLTVQGSGITMPE